MPADALPPRARGQQTGAPLRSDSALTHTYPAAYPEGTRVPGEPGGVKRRNCQPWLRIRIRYGRRTPQPRCNGPFSRADPGIQGRYIITQHGEGMPPHAMGSVPAGKRPAFAAGSVHAFKEYFAYTQTTCHVYTNDSQDLVRNTQVPVYLPVPHTHGQDTQALALNRRWPQTQAAHSGIGCSMRTAR